MDCSLPGSSVHGILQTRILKWVAISFSRGSSWLRDQTKISYLVGRLFTAEPLGKPEFQARILEWVAISFSRGSSLPKDWTQVSYTAGRFFTDWATREAWMEAKWGNKIKKKKSFLTVACVVAKIKGNLNNMKCYYRCLWFQRKSRNNLRNPSLEAENLTWTTLCGVSHILWKTFKLDSPLGRKKKKDSCIATTYLPFCFSQPLEFMVFSLLLHSWSKAILQAIDPLERRLIISDLWGCFHPRIVSLGEAFSTRALTEYSRGRKGLLWQLCIIHEPMKCLSF